MKKIFTVLLLITLSLTVMGNTVDAKKVVEDPIIEEDLDLSEEPIMAMAVSCPPGVPCDDNGGGGSGSYDYRDDPVSYPSSVTNYITQPNISNANFNPSIYSDDEFDNSYVVNNLRYIPHDGTIKRDSCHTLGSSYYPHSTDKTGKIVDFTDYFSVYHGINWNTTIGDLYLETHYNYYGTNHSAHDVWEIYNYCKKYDVVANKLTLTDDSHLLHWSPVGDENETISGDVYIIPNDVYFDHVRLLIEEYEDANGVNFWDVVAAAGLLPISLGAKFVPIVGPYLAATGYTFSYTTFLDLFYTFLTDNSIQSLQDLDNVIKAEADYSPYIRIETLVYTHDDTGHYEVVANAYNTDDDFITINGYIRYFDFYGYMDELDIDDDGVLLKSITDDYLETVEQKGLFTIFN